MEAIRFLLVIRKVLLTELQALDLTHLQAPINEVEFEGFENAMVHKGKSSRKFSAVFYPFYTKQTDSLEIMATHWTSKNRALSQSNVGTRLMNKKRSVFSGHPAVRQGSLKGKCKMFWLRTR